MSIRIALIGLSANARASWAANAHLPYLLSPRGKERFTIVALLNSSVEAAGAAITHFGLPTSTRAYGDPAALAADPDVDLVVSNTRADTRLDSIGPSLRAGRAVYSEWPLASNAAAAKDLVILAREKTIVGLQGSWSPPVRKLAEVIASGKIGKVLSSEVWASAAMFDGVVVPAPLGFFFDSAVGANLYKIEVGHLFDSVQSVLGDVQNLHGQPTLQRPEIKLLDPAKKEITGTTISDVPDLVFITGTLPASETVQSGAGFSLRYRRSPRFKGDQALVWTINGELGEIRVMGPKSSSFHADQELTIEVHDFATGEVEKVEWHWEIWQEKLPLSARSIGLVYEAFARGDESGYPSFEHAQKRQQQLETVLNGWDPKASA